MKKRLQKFFLIVVSVLGWVMLVGLAGKSSVALATMQAKSAVAAGFAVAAAVAAIWFLMRAAKQSMAAGASTIGDLYDDLAFKFCLTPLVAVAAMTGVAIAVTN